jgi:protein gp37
MADGTHIEWTDATWNPITGCQIISPGCTNCYAMRLAGTRMKHHPSREGLTREVNGKPVWTGGVRFNEEWLDQPIRWKKPRRIFVVAHGDLAYSGVSDEMLCRIFNVIEGADHHRYQILTKRPHRLYEFLEAFSRPMNNVLIGTSVERQQEADDRRPYLESIARLGWKTWVSYEPALGQVDWSGWEFIRWMVSGGESGPGSRPTHPNWHRATRDWCATHHVPYFFKQWGDHAPEGDVSIAAGARDGTPGSIEYVNDDYSLACTTPRSTIGLRRIGKKLAGATLDGRTHREMPA